jgi:hypothetical protein
MQQIRIKDNFENKKILESFPNDAKLCYENIIHNKVYYSDLFLAIPEGKKCLTWFTTNNKGQNICYLLELEEETRFITRIRPINVCFNSELSYETIFYGSSFYYDNNMFITIEDILYYKGKNLCNQNFITKLSYLKNIFESDIGQFSYTDSFVVFGLPIITTNYNELIENINKINYNIKYIQTRYSNKKHFDNLNFVKSNVLFRNLGQNNKKIDYPNGTKRELVFKVKAELQNDIYNLYVYNNGTTDYFYDIALIPDYKTSVMMNKLFRNIKENNNLDALEESDSEDEFENENIDKFVDLEKSQNMLCVYNQRFNKWVPIRVMNKNEKIANLKRDIQQ